MKVVIDAQLLSLPKFGIQHYLENLISNINEIKGDNEVKSLSDSFYSGNSLLRIFWEHLILPGIVNSLNPDVFHSPDHILPLKKVKCKKKINFTRPVRL